MNPLLPICKEILEWMHVAPFDFNNGIVHQGIDEGNVIGWRIHSELVEKLTAAIAETNKSHNPYEYT